MKEIKGQRPTGIWFVQIWNWNISKNIKTCYYFFHIVKYCTRLMRHCYKFYVDVSWLYRFGFNCLNNRLHAQLHISIYFTWYVLFSQKGKCDGDNWNKRKRVLLKVSEELRGKKRANRITEIFKYVCWTYVHLFEHVFLQKSFFFRTFTLRDVDFGMRIFFMQSNKTMHTTTTATTKKKPSTMYFQKDVVAFCFVLR